MGFDTFISTIRFTNREHPFIQNPEQLEDADEEVLAERERVNTLKTTDQEEEVMLDVWLNVCF